MIPRSSGILLHPTSLPGPFGIGDIGPVAHSWVDTLASAKQSWWQILPVGPTGYGDSPYQSFSTFAGNLNLLSPAMLENDNLIPADELNRFSFPADRVDFAAVEPFKLGLVRRAWNAFVAGSALHLADEFERFQHERRDWLDDYALFMAIKDSHGGDPWFAWPAELRRRDPQAMRSARMGLAEKVRAYEFGQFLFFASGTLCDNTATKWACI